MRCRVSGSVGRRLPEGPAPLLAKMASGKSAGLFLLERRRHAAADRLCLGAARMEAAAGRRGQQIRRAAFQADAARMVVERLREGARPQEIRVAESAVAQAESDLEQGYRVNLDGKGLQLLTPQVAASVFDFLDSNSSP